MMGGQDAGCTLRGIGRYLAQFIPDLTHSDTANEYILYSFDRFDPWTCQTSERVQTRIVPAGTGPVARAAQHLADANPDQLDLYLVTSPFTEVQGYRPPCCPCNGLRMASLFYDLIPLLPGGEFYLTFRPDRPADYFERLARLRNYDLLLAISAATRNDAITQAGMPAERVVDISAATRAGFFAPPTTGELPEGLKDLGMEKPYVLGFAAEDPHKNTVGLIQAFSLLAPPLRDRYQLVLVGTLPEDSDKKLTERARRLGVAERLVQVGRLTDERLREAYQHCAAFAFVSHCEGFGLPILEAMQCAAPVVAGNNSSQVELAGGAGLLADTHDPGHIAEQVTRILTDPGLAAELRRLGLERSSRFTWPDTVRRARQAFQALPPKRVPQPLLAVVWPWPVGRGKDREGVSSLDRLRGRYTVHVYHAPGPSPSFALARSEMASFDYRLFERQDRVWNYQAVVYYPGAGADGHELLRHSTALGRRAVPIEVLDQEAPPRQASGAVQAPYLGRQG
jgi:glycosyltransferase involved in cell wall biosynthesis